MDYSPSYHWYMQPYRRQYNPVTAYTLNIPVYVNGTDINNPPYPAINYQPEGAPYPFVYVPIAQFSKVGAKVKWQEESQTINVTTDYFDLKQFYQSQQTYPPPEARIKMCQDALAAMRLAYEDVSSKISVPESTEGKIRFNGTLEDGRAVFDGQWWNGPTANLTVGEYYVPQYDAAAGSAYLLIKNDVGEEVAFRKSTMELSV